MIKKFFVTSIIYIFLVTNSFSAGSSSSGGDGGAMKSSYEKAVSYIKSAKKLEKKGKLEKANKKYAKAQKLLLKSNKKNPSKPDTLNYLGFTTRKLGDFENGEKYYLQGLAINPTHIGINEYLGELYVATGRHNLAVERLEVLKGCNCEEYEELKAIIAGEKVSKY
jgi:tetratricopeptide (TPR) repeat protein